MAQNRLTSFGPVALANAVYTTNILTPAAAGGSAVGYTPTASYIILRKIRIINTTGGALTFRLYIGATGANAAGTEFLGKDTSIAANASIEVFCQKRLDVGQFLVGAGSNTGLTLEADGEVGLA